MNRLALALIVLSASPVLLCADEDPNWERQKLDGTFRSEGVAVGDFNKDGRLDVAAGDVWYAAPDWTMHEIRKPGEYFPDKGYSQSFACWAWDVNLDGWDDVIIVGFPGAPCHWYENPKNEPGHWKAHVIWHSACNESPDFLDITGDGRPELVLGSQPERQLGFLSLPHPEDATKKWEFHAISEPGEPGRNGSFHYYHGLGAGDLNGDGRTDVLIPHGWYEAPENRKGSPWRFHPYTLSKDGKGNPLPMSDLHVEDLDLDGDMDIIGGSAHAFGLWWFENTGSKDHTEFKYHLIDESYSQTHAIEFVDLNGDGKRDIVTGKRYFAHQGKDPGGRDPVVMYWYEIERTKGQAPKFHRHEIVAGRDTGVGTQFLVHDMNGDERPDIVLSNKKGANVLLQRSAGQ